MHIETLASVLIASGLFAIPIDPPRSAEPPPPAVFTVRQVHLTGNHLLPTGVLIDALAIPTERPISYPRLGSAVAALNETYVHAGYAFCGVLDSAQLHYDWSTNTLDVHVVEAHLGTVRVTGPRASAVDPAQLAALHSGEPVRVNTVMEFMRAAAAKGATAVSDPLPALDLSTGRVDLTFELR